MKYSVAPIFAFLMASSAAMADPVVPGAIERYTYTYVTPNGPGFTGSSFVYNNTINFNTGAGERDETINFRPVATGITLYGQGGTVLSATTAPDGTLALPEAFTSPGGAGQGYGFDYNGAASAALGDSFLTYGVFGGFEALFFDGGGTNLLDSGGRFVSSVVIKGDWSKPTSHTAATFSNGYFIDDDFVYDSINDRTLFTVETDNYVADGFTNPTISFALLGLPVDVPEPLTLGLFSAGIAGAAAMRRRKKA